MIKKCSEYSEGSRKPYFPSMCSATDHNPTCGGYSDDCDKELNICVSAVWQGCEVWCKKREEISGCRSDLDFCEIIEKEKI